MSKTKYVWAVVRRVTEGPVRGALTVLGIFASEQAAYLFARSEDEARYPWWFYDPEPLEIERWQVFGCALAAMPAQPEQPEQPWWFSAGASQSPDNIDD